MLICKRCRSNKNNLLFFFFFNLFRAVLTPQCNHSRFLSLPGQITHEASQANYSGIKGNSAFLVSCLPQEPLPFQISASSFVFVAFSVIKVTEQQLSGSSSPLHSSRTCWLHPIEVLKEKKKSPKHRVLEMFGAIPVKGVQSLRKI